MHAILVPIKDGRLQADIIRGYKQISKERNHSLYGFLKGNYGLHYPERLRGVRKVIGADLAIMKARRLSPEDLLNMIHLELEAAIHARPEPFLSALGISYHWIEDEIEGQERALMEMEYEIRNDPVERARRKEIDDDVAF